MNKSELQSVQMYKKSVEMISIPIYTRPPRLFSALLAHFR
jgi:hypothetical protein